MVEPTHSEGYCFMSENERAFRSDLLLASRQGTWWEVVTDPRYTHENSIRAAVDLHNSGEIDFIHLYLNHLIEIADREFFIAMYFFCKVLPEIDGCPSEIINLVNKMTDLAAADAAANEPKGAFRDWCSRRQDRPGKALELIKSRPCSDLGVLSLVLQAGAKFDLRSYVREALEFTRAPCETRLSGVTALGRIDTSGDAELQAEAISALRNVHDSTDDDIVTANVVSASSHMYSRDASLLDRGVDCTIRKASSVSGPATQIALADVIQEHHADLPDDLLDIILGALVNAKPEHSRVLDGIDFALAKIDLVANENRVCTFLSSFLLSHGRALSIGAFRTLMGPTSRSCRLSRKTGL